MKRGHGSARSRVRRIPERAHYDRETVHAILDEALICHVSFVQEGQPFIIPTIHARRGDELLLHGARASRLLKHAASGAPLAIAVTLLDGLVIARSTFNSSMNYRSVVIFGHGRAIEAHDDRLDALRAFSDQLVPGRWEDSRPNTPQETAASAIVAVTIDDATAKIRAGGVSDEPEEFGLPYWAGVLPIFQQVLPPLDDPNLPAGTLAPGYIRQYTRARRVSKP
jgi:nitroimidazol reductase NimA-like FMN-containing flavoprotein (pyridoxamine 5'-phosphate oxidase superfamily)